MRFRVASLLSMEYPDSTSRIAKFRVRYDTGFDFKIKGSQGYSDLRDGELHLYDRNIFKEEYKAGSIIHVGEWKEGRVVHPQSFKIDAWLSERLFESLIAVNLDLFEIHITFSDGELGLDGSFTCGLGPRDTIWDISKGILVAADSITYLVTPSDK